MAGRVAGQRRNAGLSELHIRPVDVGDADRIAAIYEYYVRTGTATFDTEPLPPQAWAQKITAITDRAWPFLVATDGKDIVGYAYASQFRDRAAYAHSCENSLYIRSDYRGRGIGRMILGALCDAAQASGFAQMIAVISEGEDVSIALHEKLGFEHRGRLTKVGFKFGKLLDTIYMQRDFSRA